MNAAPLSALLLLLCSVQHAATDCVFRGHCANDDDTGKAIPCAVRQKPAPMGDDSSWRLFSDVCPQLAAEVKADRAVCCDVSQVQDLARELEQPASLGMTKCPACMLNFKDLLCRMTCSPNQSQFLAVNATAKTGSRPHVAEMVYALRPDYAQGVYDSCKDVRSVVLGIKLMTLMCGGRVLGCSPQKWLDFLGSTSAEGGYSPFKIHHVITERPVAPLGRPLTPLVAPFLMPC
ncbi:hypothetical protein HPB49_004795 [Dermacentor silvarum]|uniref:Uncharacterized protein n=1 Tax=Dermacentor silvarum TaxID=543639 RepID=A0ACB8DV62_DERSI|nr:NPC intracellular cholesterol transporter 1 [Dermacentor silvarum]XP_049526036.1 NPC intracellular cholesterol transporter 1 [Dermacentor silvarum]XP_049526038.1 NPC intracellular cholesterol transporter 1 [Dermacentor silvarum]KAH7978200.1 hypothetical protein HPB49_004795 [Dermacentor silvarum]